MIVRTANVGALMLITPPTSSLRKQGPIRRVLSISCGVGPYQNQHHPPMALLPVGTWERSRRTSMLKGPRPRASKRHYATAYYAKVTAAYIRGINFLRISHSGR